ncbi:hypothetical protein [Variovorax sp. LjRoot84]|uniref:hypothetical protein n=1 Tax=Variovorax sp. LjRoot84 TaxID=3342340 RepID=UPI003F50F5AF
MTVERLAAVLDVPVAYFYAVDDDTAAMLLAFHALTPERRIKALEIITRMQ